MTRLREHYGGWIPQRPDPRDRSFNAEERIFYAAQLPGRHDLWDEGLCPPIWDQGTIGSCTAHGSLRAYIVEANRQGITLPAAPKPTGVGWGYQCQLSRLMQYYDTRALEGMIGADAGGVARDAIRALATVGCAPETEWRYVTSRFAEKPPAAAFTAAKQHLALRYQGINPAGPGAPLRTAVAQGMAVVFGFAVPSYFEDGSWDPATPLPLPGAGVQFIGGHCVAITGYDFTRTHYPEPYFICDNSWDVSWGSSFSSKDMSGRFAIAAGWMNPTSLVTSDFWVIQQDT
jgi:C1A family cysteine protease